jgi:cell division protein FtsL
VAGIAFISATVTLAALFAAAVFQTVLVQGQQRLDQLDRRVSQEQDQFDQLRAKVAELESLERIVAVVSATGQALPDDRESDAATSGAGRSWSQLKPLVGSAP